MVHRSYRDKINERFNNVKKKAGKSNKRASIALLETVKRESGDVDVEVQSVRNRLNLDKMAADKSTYDFFCVEKYQQTVDAEYEPNTKSTDDLVEDGRPVVFRAAQRMHSILSESEAALFFRTTARPVHHSEKLEGEPRFLTEEGLYVPPKPKMPSHHRHILEQRLSRDSRKWFNCEGHLEIVENPIQKTSYRPRLRHLPISETTTYLPSSLQHQECEEIVVVADNLLLLHIASVNFEHHPLFSLEHVLAQKIRRLCQEYDTNISQHNMERLCRRLEGLRQILKSLEETEDQSEREEEKMDAYRRDIKVIKEQLFQEGKNERDQVKQILEIWKAIKKLRQSNGYSNTSVRLTIKKEKVDCDIDRESFQQNFDEAYKEVLHEQPRKKKRGEEAMKKELLKRFEDSFRIPGEPLLHFVLVEDNDITKCVDHSKETARRSVVASTKMVLKILYDHTEICKTKSLNLEDNFVCHFNENVSIQLTNVSKFLTIEIIEHPKALVKRTVGHVTVKLPPRTLAKSEEGYSKFCVDDIVHYKHEGIGSGVNVDGLVQELSFKEISWDAELKTSGFLTYSLKWDSPVSKQHANETNTRIADDIIDKYAAIDADKLTKWMDQQTIDPQNPKNSILYEYSLEWGDQEVLPMTNNKYFRLSPHMDDFQFCDPKMIEANLRLKVLRLRNQNEPEFDKMVVPNRIKEIPLDILADYNRRISSEQERSIEEEEDEDDQIEEKRNRGRKQLKQVHIKVFQKCKNSQDNLTFEDVIDEKFLLHFQKVISVAAHNFLNWFQWSPLKKSLPKTTPSPREPKLTDYELHGHANIIINVISALNLPERLTGEVAPFVEIAYNNTTARSSTSKGPHPTWNEQLALPLEPSHLDYLNPNSLNGTLTVHIFDEHEKILTKSGGMKARTWLGCLEIPLSAICGDGIQGMFRLNLAQLLLDYKSKELEQQKQARTNNSQANKHSYINLEFWLDPNVPKLSPNIEELPCVEVPYIKEHVLKWNESYNCNYPNRKFSVLAIDVNGATVCVVRYIRPLEPPQLNAEGFDVTADQCARFVSLIPFTNGNKFYNNIWLPADRFLHFMLGSVIDHAVLLTCYLLALKLEAWLLLGFGLPQAYTAFVLVKEHDGDIPMYYIYDMVFGEKVNLTDSFCPLQNIYCIVNQHNVWANIQRNDNISLIRFDLSRRSDWLPLFDEKIQAPTNPIQLQITYCPNLDTSKLEIALDRKIRKRMAKLRPLNRTVWNHNVSNACKSILSSFEMVQMFGKNNSENLTRIRECLAPYEIRGHVWCSPYTNVSTIVKSFKSYGLHLEKDDSTQFASAVYVRAYPNQVLAIWVFLAAIIEKRQADENLSSFT